MTSAEMGRLESAEERHAESPETFWIPERTDRDSLQPGDCAKVIFKTYTGDRISGERIWILVTGRVGDMYVGTLNNEPYIIGKRFGDRVCFRAEHVIDIERGTTPIAEERATNNVRGYLIDSEKATIEEIWYDGGDIDVIKKLLNCQRFTLGARLQRNGDGDDTIYASDDYLEDRNPKFWFQVDADQLRPTSHPIAGNGLVHGCDEEGRICDVTIPIEEVRARITFTRREFRGFIPTEGGVLVDAPIVGDPPPRAS